MIIRILFVSLAAFSFVAAGARPKEAEIGSLIARSSALDIADHGYTPEQRGRVAMAQYARCKFGREPHRVSDTLQLPFTDSLERVKRLVSDDCLISGEIVYIRTQMRGYLFGEMYRRHEALAKRAWGYPIQSLNLTAVPPDSAPPEVRVNFMMLTMTHCLFSADPAMVREIILNQPASPAQKLAYRSLIPKLGTCVPKDSKFELSRSAIESVFGEYLYRSLVPVITDVPGKPK